MQKVLQLQKSPFPRLIAVTLFSFFLFVSPVSAYTIQQTSAVTNIINSCGYLDTDTANCDQSFTTVGAGTLTSATFRYSNDGGASHNYTMHLQGDSGGVPDGTDIEVSPDTLVQNTVPSTSGYNSCNTSGYETFTFSTNSLSAATKYHLVLMSDVTDGSSNGLRVCGDTSSGTYADGNAANSSASPTTWNSLAGSAEFLLTLTGGGGGGGSTTTLSTTSPETLLAVNQVMLSSMAVYVITAILTFCIFRLI